MANVMHSLETGQYVPDTGWYEMGLQAKLTIGKPGDKYEQEADRVARQVVQQINSPRIVEEEVKGRPQQEIQRKALTGGIKAPINLEGGIKEARGRGKPLSDSIRHPLEQAMGADFSGVRVHTDARADQLNQSIQAKAFTTGQDVFFRQGEYEPGSRGGQELIAHELAHTLQRSTKYPPQSRRDNSIKPNADEILIQKKEVKADYFNVAGERHNVSDAQREKEKLFTSKLFGNKESYYEEHELYTFKDPNDQLVKFADPPDLRYARAFSLIESDIRTFRKLLNKKKSNSDRRSTNVQSNHLNGEYGKLFDEFSSRFAYHLWKGIGEDIRYQTQSEKYIDQEQEWRINEILELALKVGENMALLDNQQLDLQSNPLDIYKIYQKNKKQARNDRPKTEQDMLFLVILSHKLLEEIKNYLKETGLSDRAQIDLARNMAMLDAANTMAKLNIRCVWKVGNDHLRWLKDVTGNIIHPRVNLINYAEFQNQIADFGFVEI
ncbi:MAG: DUF4157 domain-containing protein [Moorea sp. SIO2I5]|nr:DUF4157 domain-containing protein [Moorena sp. SIO2I5]